VHSGSHPPTNYNRAKHLFQWAEREAYEDSLAIVRQFNARLGGANSSPEVAYCELLSKK